MHFKDNPKYCYTHVTSYAPVVYYSLICCVLLPRVKMVFTLSGGEGVHLPGLYYGGLSNSLHCEFGNINTLLL